MSETGSDRVQTILTEGIIIALGSAYVYLIAFFYERGYCEIFGIPTAFISPNLTTILIAAAAIITFLFSSLSLLGFSVPLIRAATKPGDSNEPYKPFFRVNAFLLIFALLTWSAYGYKLMIFIVMLTIIVAFNILFFGIDILINWKKKTMRERFAAAAPVDGIINVLSDKFGYRNMMILVNLVLILFLANIIGSGEAVKQKRFYVLKDSPNYVLLRTYGDMMIAATFDRKKRLVGNNFLLVRISAKDKIELIDEIIGPLERSIEVASPNKETIISSPTISTQ